MDNFDLRKFLAEGKLNEAMSAQDTEDIAGMVADEFTKESADEGEYLRYSVGRVEGDFFELDTEATDMSSEDLDMRGVGEGWGGNFSVEVTEDGHEVRNAEKGGLVAIIDSMGNFKMLSADESRAEMGLEEGEMLDEGMLDGIKDKIVSKVEKIKDKFSAEEIEKMKSAAERALGKSVEEFTMADFTMDNIKKVGKAVNALNEEQIEESLGEKIQGIGSGLGMASMFIGGNLAMGSVAGGIEGFIAGAIAFVLSLIVGGIIKSRNNEAQEAPKSNKMKKSELKEMIKAAMSENARTDAEEEGYLDGMRDEKEDMKEAEDVEVEDDENIDVDVEKDVDVKVDDEESEVDVDIKASMPGESEDVEEVQALLMKAQEAAQAFGDEKLTDQIGNTITYFTRSHVSRVDEMDDMDVNVNTTEMEAELGLEEAQNLYEVKRMQKLAGLIK